MSRAESILPGCFAPQARRAFRLLSLAWLATVLLHAQTPAPELDAPKSGPVIASIQQFWDLTPEQKSHPQKFELEGTVTYFDPAWRMLFIQDLAGSGAYVPYGDNPYAFKAGETIIARGQFIPPNADINFEHAVITRRPAKESLPIIPLTHGLSDYATYKTKYVTVEGYVDRERRQDETHLQLILAVDGMAVYCWVLMDPAVPTPVMADLKVRVEGVYNAKVGPDGLLNQLELLVSSPKHVTVLSRLDEEPGFRLPVSTINSLAKANADKQVRVIGTCRPRPRTFRAHPGRHWAD